MKIQDYLKQDLSWAAFIGAVFAAGISLPLSRFFVVVCLVLTLRRPAPECRPKFRLTPPCLGWILYLTLALVVTGIMAAVNTDELLVPKKGLAKITKLLWYVLLPLGVIHLRSQERITTTLKALVLGCSVTGLYVIGINPISAWIQITMPTSAQIASNTLSSVQQNLLAFTNTLGITDSINTWIYKGYRAQTYLASIIKLGTMQDAQRLMVALPAALCLCLDAFRTPTSRQRRLLSIAALALTFVGLTMTFKRGPLMFSVLVSFGILIRVIGIKALAALSVVFLLAASFPAARMRFSDLPQELSGKKGGRMTMWTQIVPKLHEEHPWGIGFRALTNEKMRQIAPRVEQRQNHVHSTPLQSFVDFGWPGVAAYAFWMIAALTTAIASLRKSNASSVLRFAPLAMLATLILYGLIEYNLADADVVLLYSLMMAMGTSPNDFTENSVSLPQKVLGVRP